jgi:ketosteroid isomerase-like protein
MKCMTDRASIIAAIETYCRAQSEKDKAGWSALFADDVFHEDPVGIQQNTGKDHVTGPFWEHIVRNDVKIWLTDDIIVCGNEALAIMACEIGTPDARRKISPVVDQFTFNEEGLISSVRGFYNLVGM